MTLLADCLKKPQKPLSSRLQNDSLSPIQSKAMNIHRRLLLFQAVLLVTVSLAGCAGPLPRTQPVAEFKAGYESKPSDPYFIKFNPRKAPAPGPLILKPGDRLAIIGDSITEQKMYSRIIETYLTACVPELKITARQFGWSGETAEGFLRRMTNDCLRFQPTVATLCYGMNDFKYRPFDMENEQWYADNYSAVVRNLQAAGATVVLGSLVASARCRPGPSPPPLIATN